MGRKSTQTKEQAKVKRRINAQRWRDKNAEAVKANKRAWYKRHRDRILQQQKEHNEKIRTGEKLPGPPRAKRKEPPTKADKIARKEKARIRAANKRATIEQEILDNYARDFGPKITTT